MPRKIEAYDIAGPSGRLEALLEEPDGVPPVEAVLVCHPHPQYGGTLHNKVVYRLARGLRRSGAVVLRFNFRGVGRSEGEYGNLTGETEDARAALQWLRERYPDLPWSLAGFSFGSRVVADLACGLAGARRLVAVGFPTRMGPADYLRACPVPKTFLWSTHDEFAARSGAERLFATFAEPKRAIWVEAGDHFFAGALDVLEERVANL
jgi:uncharacterized protein